MFRNRITFKDFLIILVVVTMIMLSFMGVMTLVEHYRVSEEEEILKGKPTYEGIVVSVSHSAGGFGSESITTVVLENITFGIEGIHSFKTNVYYKFWVYRDSLLRAEEVK